MLELHNVTVGRLVRPLSLTVSSGQTVSLTAAAGAGKTTLLRAVLGFLPIDGGHISIDGELLTPQSAPYFRRMTAYVPQRLTVPDGARDVVAVADGYVELLRAAVAAGKPLLIVDEPPQALTADEATAVDSLLREAAAKGAAVLAVNARTVQNQIQL